MIQALSVVSVGWLMEVDLVMVVDRHGQQLE
jgi:hypothetical protein